MILTRLPESPKWLYANNRFDEAREILKSIAKTNKSEMTAEDIDAIVFDIEDLDNKVET